MGSTTVTTSMQGTAQKQNLIANTTTLDFLNWRNINASISICGSNNWKRDIPS